MTWAQQLCSTFLAIELQPQHQVGIVRAHQIKPGQQHIVDEGANSALRQYDRLGNRFRHIVHVQSKARILVGIITGEEMQRGAIQTANREGQPASWLKRLQIR